MTIDVDELVRNGVDIAAAINEAFLNKFSASHHKKLPNLYQGKQRFSNFNNDIEIRYNVRNPIKFNLSLSVPPARFKRLWLSHLKVKGAPPSLSLQDIITTPPNARLKSDAVLFQVVVYDGHSNNEILSVDFSWDLEVLAAIVMTGNVLTLDPLRVTFSAGSSVILEEISKKIAAEAASQNLPMKPSHDITLGDPSDPVWCAKVEQLILLVINQVLAAQISNFVRSWELPRAIQIVDGIAISPTYLAIRGGDLIVGAQITTHPIGISPLQARLDSFMTEFASLAEREYRALSDQELRVWHPDTSPTIRWMGDQVRLLQETVLAELRLARESKPAVFAANLQLLFNDHPFDLLAKRYLSVDKGWTGSVSLDHLLKADAGWWFKVQNARGKVVAGGVQVDADVSIGGKAQICHFNLDPKHFGDWSCYGPNLELYAIPDFSIQALPSFSSDGVYLSARLLTTGIGIRFLDWPGWANDLLGWITGNMTRPLFSAIAAIVALFRVRVLQYPRYFPGTGLEWTSNINSVPGNMGPYLTFSADPDFE